jgi:ketosteroid isomerase-like protein
VVWSPIEGTYHGIDGLATHWSEWIEPWAEHRIDPEEFVQVGDQVVAVIHLTATGRGSGMEIDQRFFQLYTIRTGKIAQMTEFMSRAEALKAAGLAE